jgi:G3E family GTPase
LTTELFPSPEVGPFGRRQRHVRGHRVPVTIEPTDHATHRDGSVIVRDEFGADDLTPLRDGCACCTIRVKLQARLQRLLADREQGKVAQFSRIAIRTREDTGPIRRMFASPRALEPDFYLEGDLMAQIAWHADSARFTLTEEAPIAWDVFSRFITTLMTVRGADLLFAHGMVRIEGCPGPVVVQFEHHLVWRPVELAEWPDQDRRSRIAFLARNLDERAVRALFDSVRALVSG